MNLLEQRINNLPEDIVRYIYTEYFEVHVHSILFQRVLETNNSKSLVLTDVRKYIPLIFSKPKVCDYLCKNLVLGNFHYFEDAYIEEKLQNKKRFNLATRGNSFALSLLLYLYH